MEDFREVIGQERVKKIIDRSIKKGRLAHAYLFHGQPGVGKDAMALMLARRLLCQEDEAWGCGRCASCRQAGSLEHPYLHFIIPVPSMPKSMTEDRYFTIVREAVLKRHHNPYRSVNFYPVLSTLPLIGIDRVREMKKEAMLKMPRNGRKLFILSQAHMLNTESANSLLKTETNLTTDSSHTAR